MIALVRGALADLAGALKGSIIMSLEIEETLEAVRKASIPLPWLLQVNILEIKAVVNLFPMCSFLFLARATQVIAPYHPTLKIWLSELTSSTNGSRYIFNNNLELRIEKTSPPSSPPWSTAPVDLDV